jgi:hypothetical protein
MRRWKGIFLSLVVAWCAIPAVPALAAPVNVFEEACNTPGTSASEACMVSGANPITGNDGTIAKVTRLLSYITGIAAIILIMIGGIMYALSGGDSGKVSSAKNTIIYAAIGLFIVIISQAIIIFVLNKIA